MKHPRKAKHIRQKQQEKRFTRWFAAGGMAFVLLAIGGLLFWQSNQTLPEPIKIYKSTPWTPSPTRKSTTAGTQQPDRTSHIHHPDDGHHHESVPPEKPTDASKIGEVLDDETPTDISALTDADIATLDHEALHAKIERIGKEFESILAEINEKYPEVQEVMSISHEELHKRYPTQASREALNERLDQMRSEFKDRAIQLLSELPTETQLEYIIRIDEQISKTHGDEAANEMTAELLDKLKL